MRIDPELESNLLWWSKQTGPGLIRQLENLTEEIALLRQRVQELEAQVKLPIFSLE